MSGSPVPIIPAGADQYEWARRWPRRRGGFEIEKQCARCRWWFDSFDPQCTKCHICEEDGSDSHNPSAALIRSIPVSVSTPIPAPAPAPAPAAPVPQQTEALLTPPALLPMLGTLMGNTQLNNNNTPYQTYGSAGYGTLPTPSYGSSSGPMPNLTGAGGFSPNQNQTWGPQGGYAALPLTGPSSYTAADALFGPPLRLGYPQNNQNQVFDHAQGYLTSPSSSLFHAPGTGTMYDFQGMYAPGAQAWGQHQDTGGMAMAWNPFYFPEMPHARPPQPQPPQPPLPPLPPPPPPNQNYGLGDHAILGNPLRPIGPGGDGGGAKSNKIRSTVPVPVTPPRPPLRPLLPRTDPSHPIPAKTVDPAPAPAPVPPSPPSPPHLSPRSPTPLPVPASLAAAALSPVMSPPAATIPATPPQPQLDGSSSSSQHKGDNSPYREWLKRQASYRNAVKSYGERSRGTDGESSRRPYRKKK